MFSILVAHYNNYEYFKDCYKSIIGQTFNRRNINEIFEKKVSEIESLPEFIFKKENTWLKKIFRKII